MLLKRIKKHLDFSALKEELKKLGVNFITAGVVGVFIYHYVGTNLASMLWASGLITVLGFTCLCLGIRKTGDVR